MAANPAEVVAATRRWVEKAVIGLDLCPFAGPAYARSRIRFVVSEAETPEALLADLLEELHLLAETPAGEIETTLLIHPGTLAGFLEFNDFLGVAESAVADLGLEGVLQVASFHPAYQFAGTHPDDVTNFTNRSPYPILHLLREESVERAVESCADPSEIYRKNMETLRRLGLEGWRRLGIESPRRS